LKAINRSIAIFINKPVHRGIPEVEPCQLRNQPRKNQLNQLQPRKSKLLG
jgi:hypothetical protein